MSEGQEAIQSKDGAAGNGVRESQDRLGEEEDIVRAGERPPFLLIKGF